MEQPLPIVGGFDAPAELLAALGAGPPALPIETYVNGPTNVMVALADEDAVAGLAPDFQALRALGTLNVSCFAGRRARAGKRGCSRPPTASPRIPRPARRPARSRCISPATAGSASARRS